MLLDTVTIINSLFHFHGGFCVVDGSAARRSRDKKARSLQEAASRVSELEEQNRHLILTIAALKHQLDLVRVCRLFFFS